MPAHRTVFLGGLHAKPEFRRRTHRVRAGSFKGFWLQAALCMGDQPRRYRFFPWRINQKWNRGRFLIPFFAFPLGEGLACNVRGPLPSLTKNASIFRQIHLPLKGKAWGTIFFVSPPGITYIPRCSLHTGGMVEELLNERAARRVRRRVVHLFTAVAPLQCIAGATSPRGFFESQRGAAGGPLARTSVRLKPCRPKGVFPGFLDVSYGSYESKGKLENDLFRRSAPPSGGLPARSR